MVFWDVMSCSLVDMQQCSSALKMEAADFSRTWIPEYMTLSQKDVLLVFTMRTSLSYFKLFTEGVFI
jgi:hypothetical protein